MELPQSMLLQMLVVWQSRYSHQSILLAADLSWPVSMLYLAVIVAGQVDKG
jgi:hypothetical protein